MGLLFFLNTQKFSFGFVIYFLVPHYLLGLLFFLIPFCLSIFSPLISHGTYMQLFFLSYQTKDFKKKIEVLFSIMLEYNFYAFWLAIVEILTCSNFKHIWTTITHQQECGSFIRVGFPNLLKWNGASAKIGHGWWLWLSKTWTFIKGSTSYVDVVTTINISCEVRKWYSKFWTISKETWWQVLCQSYLGLQATNKICFCCLHHQNFHRK